MKKIIFTLLSSTFILNSCSSIDEPEYRDIKDIKIMNVGVVESTAGIDMLYYNPNGFGVHLSDAYGQIYIDTAYFGRFTMEQEIRVPRRSEFVVPALLRVDMVSIMRNGRGILSKKEALVKIDGYAKVRKAGISKSIPIHYQGMQNIEKLRQLVSVQ